MKNRKDGLNNRQLLIGNLGYQIIFCLGIYLILEKDFFGGFIALSFGLFGTILMGIPEWEYSIQKGFRWRK